MTNTNDEDVDLGLALGLTNYSEETWLDGSRCRWKCNLKYQDGVCSI